jgi:hypothetical protein
MPSGKLMSSSLLIQEAMLIKSLGRIEEAKQLFAQAAALEVDDAFSTTDKKLRLVCLVSAATCWSMAELYLECLTAIEQALDLEPPTEILKELIFLESEAKMRAYGEEPDLVAVVPAHLDPQRHG